MANHLRAQSTLSQSHKSQVKQLRRKMFLETLEPREMFAADAVLTWNEYLHEVVRTDNAQMGPTRSSRAYAMVHLAIYDAVNAIDHGHTPYLLTEQASSTASIDAAVAAAASAVIKELYPEKSALVDGWYADELDAITDGPEEDEGVYIGEAAAEAMLGLRDADGSNAVKAYKVNKAVGHWRPDPTILGTPQMALDPAWGKVTPFIINTTNDYHIPAPPKLTSAEYAAAYNEVKEYGALNSTVRTPDQTEIGIFWAYDRKNFGPPLVLYNQNMADIAAVQGNDVVENARLFALGNVAMADAGVVIWDYKYRYEFWRPVSAIREGAKDNNPLTTGDPTWVPLGAPGDPLNNIPDFTPPFPAYGSGHAGFGAALFQVLENFYGDDALPFTLHSDEGGGLSRNYTSYDQAAWENGKSRIYLGVHWDFDNQLAQQQGRGIADFVTEKLFLPIDGTETVLSVRKNGGGLQSIALADDANVLIKRVGANVQVIDQSTSTVLCNVPMAKMEHIVLDVRNGQQNMLTIDLNAGPLPTPFTIDVLGGTGDGDSVVVLGSARAELLRLHGDELSLGAQSPTIYLPGVEVVTLAGKAGNDSFHLLGNQTGRSINLQGDSGNDVYKIGTHGAAIVITDSAGTDTLDFSFATAAVEVDLALSAGQVQPDVGDNTLQLTGLIDNLDGSAFDDKLFGNTLGNRIRGFAGNDILRGEGGNDVVDGGEGEDIILGGVGSDKIYGGLGRDLLIGGLGIDALDGGGGAGNEDILIGGTTAFDLDEAALLDIMAEWTSANSNIDRVNNLKDGSGVAPKNNGDTYLNLTTVFNDNAIDSLFYSPGDLMFKFNPDLQKKG
ncbi:Bifunctional hemolysin/adenylate cyclase precursor [Anatilimnocola aggregata]|uniref:Bifunctional hemolysin/adenylate cyclase n=1 Tax=Anatilimnocola aggregata TaxID=2528021 RepID=A0A517YA83_9BACT|nr:hypothetical protein [Anatilimnocola aggregata]QDU27101.1 Bifunctional hemolysin/adenylate cyclase precursor [Anatilimnocola aggregata]